MWLKPAAYKEVGEALAGLRKRAGLTQQDVAKRLRKPQSFVSSYEAGQRRIDILEFLKIAETLGLDAVKAFATVARVKTPAAKKRF